MSYFIRNGKVFVDVGGEIIPTRDPLLIGNAVLDSIQTEAHLNGAIERFKLFLQKEKLKKTPERFAILESICNLEEPFTVLSIHEKLLAHYRVTSATVYNTFQLLKECNIIKAANETNGELFKTTFFELN